ncbi:class I SAM-dependent methyltransferase [Vibrio tubiashii]|uniref:class I SAM-dependent methyltransferase n=1 Tax=Vibrio tubiashii TaxID=29498 RepID=UPI00234E7444|nr:class I SAM-dependent methyltransferase [Vibrio tubiashii]WCP67808.1 class I SAM-dependent methyltransferase [Vibrio tubiashii]
MSSSSSFYEQNAEQLCAQYNALQAESVNSAWCLYWPISGDKVLDVGAGCGRDAKWMAESGCEVYAIEPCQALRNLGSEHTGESIVWLDDSLPALSRTTNLSIRFDVILVSAVWMHLAPTYRKRAFRKLANLLAPNGKLIITLRHGEFDDGRVSYDVSVEELEQLSKDSALLVHDVTDQSDQLNRCDVSWQTVVMTLPDDGSGDLNRVRHIIVNDTKAATYKLALLRTLLRIADAHSGAVIDRSDGKVAIPLGLVALYWNRQFKRLIDIEDIQQSANSSAGLGFVKPEGWGKLTHLAAEDLAVGSFFTGEEAKALDKAIRDTLATLKSGPVKYTYQSDISNPYFHMNRKTSKKTNSYIIDLDFLESYGEFVLDESLWDCFRLYHSWIEPLVVNQWILEMQRFEKNKQRNISLQTYHDCLVWIDQKHNTRDVRTRVEVLRKDSLVMKSVWSGKSLKNDYHIDHCLPFAHWPNNDKWNLLPTTAKENLDKKDRLPTHYRLCSSRQRILEWWQLAWGENEQLQQCFFSEATLALPNVPNQCRDFEQVFEALGLQVRGVKSRLLVGEW